jgi:hypothetical protein
MVQPHSVCSRKSVIDTTVDLTGGQVPMRLLRGRPNQACQVSAVFPCSSLRRVPAAWTC